MLQIHFLRYGNSQSIGVPALWGVPAWSPDGRYLASTRWDLGGTETVVFDLLQPADGVAPYGEVFPLVFSSDIIGPYPDSVLAGWRPGRSEALLLGDLHEDEYALGPRPFRVSGRPQLLSLPGGSLRTVPTADQFWKVSWSPDGALIAAGSSATMSVAFVDPMSGAVYSTPLLDEASRGNDFAWSASGGWLTLQPPDAFAYPQEADRGGSFEVACPDWWQ